MAQNNERPGNHKENIDLISSDKWGFDIQADRGSIEKNFIDIKNRIAPYTPRIIGVTKYYGQNAIIEGYKAGLRDFAESRAIEAAEKIATLPPEVKENSTFHFIGHLQSNKVNRVLKIFDYIHSVDSLKLARVISEENVSKRSIKILLQVNLSKEATKSGFQEENFQEDFSQVLKMENFQLVGLMQMLPFGANESEQRTLFRKLRFMRDDLEQRFGVRLPELSMGMSDDYQIAAQEGATMIRIGRKLFKK